MKDGVTFQPCMTMIKVQIQAVVKKKKKLLTPTLDVAYSDSPMELLVGQVNQYPLNPTFPSSVSESCSEYYDTLHHPN